MKGDGIILLMMEFNDKCRCKPTIKPLMAGQTNKRSDIAHSSKSEIEKIHDDLLYFGNFDIPDSPIIYLDSTLNLLNIMVIYL